VRGPERSRPPLEIIAEVERLVGEGVLEIVLLGQNVNSYGRDAGIENGFADIFRAVSRVDGIRRVKFETSHPRDLNEEVLRVMAEEPSACEYLHLPVQSGSNRVLDAMKRGYTREYFLRTAAVARRIVPSLTLTTDIIVGFPGETEDDFQATRDLVQSVRFDQAYIFLYSEREGTAASLMGGEVPEEVKHRRYEQLAGVQDAITSESLDALIGTRQEVLVEGPAKRGGMLAGRTRGHRVVLIPKEDAADGILAVEISAAGGHSLRGRATDASRQA
jgi:tRNA-2-methylthio-N6-dimethylallyladenosine synthase